MGVGVGVLAAHLLLLLLSLLCQCRPSLRRLLLQCVVLFALCCSLVNHDLRDMQGGGGGG